MSWKLTGLVSHKITGSPVRRLILLTMCDKANDDGTGVYASFATLARECELGRATARRTIKEFESDGLIQQVGTQPCANGETNDYTINVAAIRALPDMPKDRVQKRPGSQRTRSRQHPVQSEPGHQESTEKQHGIVTDPVQSEPGSERTGFSVTPKPISLSNERDSIVSSGEAVAVPVSKEVIGALIARAGDACDPTAPSLHHGAQLNRLLRGGCLWADDIEPACDQVAASFRRRGKRFSSWELLVEHAVANRDVRLAGLPAPQPVTDQPRRGGGQESPTSVIQRLAREGRI